MDVGYPNMTSLSEPYKGIRYYHPNFRNARQLREGKEMFNCRRFSLRNIIGCYFSFWKARGQFRHMAPFLFEKEKLIIVASIDSEKMQLLIKCFDLLRKMKITSIMMTILILPLITLLIIWQFRMSIVLDGIYNVIM